MGILRDSHPVLAQGSERAPGRWQIAIAVCNMSRTEYERSAARLWAHAATNLVRVERRQRADGGARDGAPTHLEGRAGPRCKFLAQILRSQLGEEASGRGRTHHRPEVKLPLGYIISGDVQQGPRGSQRSQRSQVQLGRKACRDLAHPSQLVYIGTQKRAHSVDVDIRTISPPSASAARCGCRGEPGHHDRGLYTDLYLATQALRSSYMGYTAYVAGSGCGQGTRTRVWGLVQGSEHVPAEPVLFLSARSIAVRTLLECLLRSFDFGTTVDRTDRLKSICAKFADINGAAGDKCG